MVFTVLGAVAKGDGVTETEQTRTDGEFEAAGRILKFWCPKQNVDQAIDNKLSKYHGPELFSKSVCLSLYNIRTARSLP
jgi:hypothetical protein